MSKPNRTTLTIADGGTTSTAFEHQGSIIDSFQFPAAMTGATSVTVEVSNNNVNFNTLLDVEGNESASYTFQANYSRALPVKCRAFWYMRFVANGAVTGGCSIVVLSRP